MYDANIFFVWADIMNLYQKQTDAYQIYKAMFVQRQCFNLSSPIHLVRVFRQNPALIFTLCIMPEQTISWSPSDWLSTMFDLVLIGNCRTYCVAPRKQLFMTLRIYDLIKCRSQPSRRAVRYHRDLNMAVCRCLLFGCCPSLFFSELRLRFYDASRSVLFACSHFFLR